MAHRTSRHLSFANVTSITALVFAMGGTGYALTIPKNSIGSTQIKQSGVASSDIRADAVNSAKVKNGSLLAADFALGQLSAGAAAATGPAGATGPSGAPGAGGATGPQGVPGVVAGTIVRRVDHTLADGQATTGSQGNVACAADEKPVGGGANLSDINHGDARMTGSGPRTGTVAAVGVPADGSAWTVWRATGVNPVASDATAVSVRVFIICAPA
jgi:hypothetical protein